MNAGTLIADLDRELALSGTSAVLRRRVNTTGTFRDANIKARFVFAGSNDMPSPSGTRQRVATAIFTMTQIVAANWPSGSPGGALLARVPRAADIIQIDGIDFAVESANPIFFGASIVRVEAQVRG